ncbi:MAG: UDP-N-acetylmuramate dehydrogenase [Smithella sp.]
MSSASVMDHLHNGLRDLLQVFSANDLICDYDLKDCNTMGISCHAQFFLQPSSVEAFSYLQTLRAKWDFPVFVIGAGSNVLFKNDALPGCVVSTAGIHSATWIRRSDGYDVIAQAGYPVKTLVREMISRNLGGAEFLVGIPGSVGGAIMGNAGAQGRGIGDIVTWVEVVETTGERTVYQRESISWGYRYSSLGSDRKIVVLSCLHLPFLNVHDAARMNCMSYWKHRLNQPCLGERSAGCIFKNPEGESAGRLLDIFGCKGMRHGDAYISQKHANFIINRGKATFYDVIFLIDKCKQIVKHNANIDLDLEVKFLGV